MRHRFHITPKRIVWVVICTALLFVGWKYHQATHPSFHGMASSDSPDGQYRCVVGEKVPPFPFESPYTYRYEIIDIKSGKTLPGSICEFETDSASCQDFTFKWNKNALEVATSYKGVADCGIVAGQQHWSEPVHRGDQ